MLSGHPGQMPMDRSSASPEVLFLICSHGQETVMLTWWVYLVWPVELKGKGASRNKGLLHSTLAFSLLAIASA